MPPARPIAPAAAPLVAAASLWGSPGLAQPPPVEPAPFQLTGALPADAFQPLIADPREPQFAAAVQFYQGDERFNVVGAANLGATVPLYGWGALGGGIWQAGVQAGVFSIFDLEADSMDLINADYLVGVPVTARYGPLSARARLLHVSSHLGDEFVLGGRVDERINLPYETVDLLLSVVRRRADRAALRRRRHGGAGRPGRPQPALRPGRRRADCALSPAGRTAVPPGGGRRAGRRRDGLGPSVSVRAGVEVQSALLTGRRLRALASYYSGHSPNGQFYERRIEFWGGRAPLHTSEPAGARGARAPDVPHRSRSARSLALRIGFIR